MNLCFRPAILTCTVLLICTTAFGQSNFTISGNLTGVDAATVELQIDKNWLNIHPQVVSSPVQNNHFEISTQLDRNYIVYLVVGSITLPLYAEPGDNLSMDVSQENGLKISLSGKCAEQNNFMQQFFTEFGADYNDSLLTSKMLSTAIDQFEMERFNQRKLQSDYLKKAEHKDQFSLSFTSFIQDQILYHYWQQLLAYPIINANSNKNILTVNPLPGPMMEGFDKVLLNKETALICDSYRDFLKYYVIYFTSKGNNFNKFKDPSISADRKQAIAAANLQGNCYSYWLSRFIIEECENLSPFIVNKMNGQLKTSDKTLLFASDVKEYSNAHLNSKIEQPKQDASTSVQTSAPQDELDLVDAEGKPVSLADFKGKTVYIDFWASWCGPCRMMMPYSKQLHDQLDASQKKKIVFLYISIDGNKDAWQKAIKDLGIEGTHAISPGNWSSKVCRYFSIQSIPRYMIMNKKGEVVEFNAKRPADPSLLDDLLKYSSE